MAAYRCKKPGKVLESDILERVELDRLSKFNCTYCFMNTLNTIQQSAITDAGKVNYLTLFYVLNYVMFLLSIIYSQIYGLGGLFKHLL